MTEKKRIPNTTVCYIEHDGQFLMLYRNKKKNDINEGKWIGIGGKIEAGETPDECNMREVREESGLILRSAKFLGLVKFRADMYGDEDMYLYYSDDFEPEDPKTKKVFAETGKFSPPLCKEGELKWVSKDDILSLPMWEGDRFFIEEILSGNEKISMTLQYEGDKCTVINE